MVNACKAVKRRRAITGCNVFLQTRMRGRGARVGTPEYKELRKQCDKEWRELSLPEREVFERRAAEQTAARNALRTQTLRNVADEKKRAASNGGAASSMPDPAPTLCYGRISSSGQNLFLQCRVRVRVNEVGQVIQDVIWS